MAKQFRTPIDLGGLEVRNFRVHVLAADPGAPVEGQMWFNSVDNVLRYYDGATVRTLNTGVDANAVHVNVAGEFAAVTLKATPVTGDLLLIEDSAAGNAKKRATVGSLPFDPAGTAAAAVAALVDSAPGTLDTLNELAAALGDDPNFATTLTTLIGTKPDKYAEDVGDGVETAWVVNHDLGTRDVVVQVYDAATFEEVVVDVEHTDADNVTLVFAEAPDEDAFRVVVIG